MGTIKKWIKTKPKLLLGILAGLVVSGVSTAVVIAAIPDANGVIHGCIRNNGNLRIIDDAVESCAAQETSLNFNQTGPQGPAGPPGGGGAGGFISTNLPNSKFRRAALQYRNLSDFNFSGSTWSGADLTGSNVAGTDFSGALFTHGDSSSDYINFSDANMQGVNFSNAQLRGNLRAIGTNFSSANFTNAVIEGGAFGAGIVPTDFTNAIFPQADFTGASFIPSPNTPYNQFQGGDFSGAQFVNATLNGIVFTNANFTGATWANTICPDGTNSDNNGNTCLGHGL